MRLTPLLTTVVVACTGGPPSVDARISACLQAERGAAQACLAELALSETGGDPDAAVRALRAMGPGPVRDTAWFSLLDHELQRARAAFERWLDPANFGADGAQREALAAGAP